MGRILEPPKINETYLHINSNNTGIQCTYTLDELGVYMHFIKLTVCYPARLASESVANAADKYGTSASYVRVNVVNLRLKQGCFSGCLGRRGGDAYYS